MRPGDVDGILAVQALAYPGFLLESAGFFLNRLALAPRHCWIADGAESGTLGYLISYPWDSGLPPVLDVELDALPDGADHWFLHDCAVSPAARLGRGPGAVATGGRPPRRPVARQPVSLQGAVSYWRRHGYAPVDADAAGLAEKLAGYGPNASYMARAFRSESGAPPLPGRRAACPRRAASGHDMAALPTIKIGRSFAIRRRRFRQPEFAAP